MTDAPNLFDRPQPGRNLPEFSVTEISAGIKRTLEDAYGRVRVRGEISAPKLHSSGHLYLSLKDSTSLLEAVCWKGTVSKLSLRPEEGMEVIATGRITTYGGRSKYQMIIEEMTLAGEGALLKLLEDRRKRLAAEGLFDDSRKKALPYMPQRIGVITSETGAVIRDILHRLQDRFPVHVLLWPVAVQGDTAAAQITDAIIGMNKLAESGNIPAPDLIIVARGGGSLEDLMAFNEESVVRAAANSRIPLISAVGHETDTTLIDYASDRRAPTPTAAAEMAVPVRRELQLNLQANGQRLLGALSKVAEHAGLKLTALSRGLGDPRRLIETASQRLDDIFERLKISAARTIERRRHITDSLSSRLLHPRAQINLADQKLNSVAARLARCAATITEKQAAQLERADALLQSHSYQNVLKRGFVLVRKDTAPVTQAADLKAGDKVQLIFGDGEKAADII